MDVLSIFYAFECWKSSRRYVFCAPLFVLLGQLGFSHVGVQQTEVGFDVVVVRRDALGGLQTAFSIFEIFTTINISCFIFGF